MDCSLVPENVMRNAFKAKGKTFTNWITNADGTITERPVKVYTVGDGKGGIYELDISSKVLGLVLETDFHGYYSLMKSVDSRHCDNAVQAAVSGAFIYCFLLPPSVLYIHVCMSSPMK
jgi:hypothetical protein